MSYPCKDIKVYNSNQWCGQIRNVDGPWSECLKSMSKESIEFNLNACALDLCLFELSNELEKKRCQTLAEFALTCRQLAERLNQTWSSTWRARLDCRNFIIKLFKIITFNCYLKLYSIKKLSNAGTIKFMKYKLNVQQPVCIH
jgi:hypothetical protein